MVFCVSVVSAVKQINEHDSNFRSGTLREHNPDVQYCHEQVNKQPVRAARRLS